MRALIFGAGGQVGRALLRSAPPNFRPVALARADCDIADAEAVAAAIGRSGADIVFNAAAFTAADQAESQPDEAMRVNAQAPGQIAAACAAAKARLVHISTDYVFEGRGSRPLRPDDATEPLNVYGRSKRAGELAVLASLPDALIVRTAWLYAADGRNFVQTMLRLMREQGRVRVVADQIGTPTCAESLAGALWALAAAGATGIHHYTDAGAASWYDFAVAIAEEAEALGLLPARPAVEQVATSDYPTPARRPGFSLLDKSDTWALLGAPPPHWRVNLRACLAEQAGHG